MWKEQIEVEPTTNPVGNNINGTQGVHAEIFDRRAFNLSRPMQSMDGMEPLYFCVCAQPAHLYNFLRRGLVSIIRGVSTESC